MKRRAWVLSTFSTFLVVAMLHFLTTSKWLFIAMNSIAQASPSDDAIYPIHVEKGDVVEPATQMHALMITKRKAAIATINSTMLSRVHRTASTGIQLDMNRRNAIAESLKNKNQKQVHLLKNVRNVQQRRHHALTLKEKRIHIAAARNYKPTVLLGNRIIYYLHIHKTGGTTLCGTAFLNGMRVNTKRNCNVQADQRCCGGEDSMQVQVSYAQKTNYQLVASEQEMYDAMNKKYYFYMVSLRNSQARYLSHWNHVRKTKKLFIPPFREWWEHQPDNFQLRMICGVSCIDTPKYQISKAQFDYTVKRLKNFEGFVFVENFKVSMEKLSKKLGWTVNTPVAKNIAPEYPRLPNEYWEDFMSVLDDALYEYALQLDEGSKSLILSEDTLKRSEAYFAEGLTHGCSDRCCGNCSKYR